MSWFTNLEKSIAGKLHSTFVDAKKLAESASNDVEAAQKALDAAKQKAADLSAQAQAAAEAAVAKAQAETAALIAEAEAAKAKAEYHASLVPATIEASFTITDPVAEPTPEVVNVAPETEEQSVPATVDTSAPAPEEVTPVAEVPADPNVAPAPVAIIGGIAIPATPAQ